MNSLCWRCLRLHHKLHFFFGKLRRNLRGCVLHYLSLGEKKEMGKRSVVTAFVIILFFHHPAQQQPLAMPLLLLQDRTPMQPHVSTPCTPSRWSHPKQVGVAGLPCIPVRCPSGAPHGWQLEDSAPPCCLQGEFPGWFSCAQHQQSR